ncbi:hypothetical protein K488DRAFT_30179, partial [Vararia minispora EC-137]
FRRMWNVLCDIQVAASSTFPDNRAFISFFLHSVPLKCIEHLLSGLRDVDAHDYMDWKEDPIFCKFKDYIYNKEAEIKDALRAVQYKVNESTLPAVMGPGRPEKV